MNQSSGSSLSVCLSVCLSASNGPTAGVYKVQSATLHSHW